MIRGSIVDRIPGDKEEHIMTRQEEHRVGDDQTDAEARMVVLCPKKMRGVDARVRREEARFGLRVMTSRCGNKDRGC